VRRVGRPGGPNFTNVAEPEPLDQFVAIGQRLWEQLAGVEEDHRRGAVDAGDQVQEHRRLGAERRDQRDPAGKLAPDHDLEQRGGIETTVSVAQRLGARGGGVIER